MTREEKETLLNEYCRKRSCGGCPFKCGPLCTRFRLTSDDIDEAMRVAGIKVKGVKPIRAVCVRVCDVCLHLFTVGKIYEFIDGVVIDDMNCKSTKRHPVTRVGAEWGDMYAKFETVEEKKVFTKADLKNGDVCVTSRRALIAMPEINSFAHNNFCGYPFYDYTDDLKSRIDMEENINHIYRPNNLEQLSFNPEIYEKGTLVFDREAEEKPIELTVKQIEEKLGVKNIKIVKE